MTNEPSESGLATELEELRARLAESEEALHAIRNGQVDAVVVAGGRGEQTYTLRGASRVYRRLVETMSEGAVTLSADGVILYGNARFAEMLERSLDRVLGKALRNYLPTEDQQALDAALAQARTETSRRQINLKTSEGHLVPVYLSASRLQGEGAEMVFCLVLTDLTEQKSHEQVVAGERLARLILEQAAEAIVVCDDQGRVIRASKAAQRFCDGSPIQRPFAEAFPLRTDSGDPLHLAPVLQGKTLRDVDVALVRQGKKLNLILNAGPLLDGRQVLGCAITLTDITERKKAEAILVQRERAARLNADIAATWTRNEALPAVLNRCVEAMVLHLDAAFARIWTLNREENVLELRASAGMYTHLNGPHGRVPVGKLKIGMIAEERRPHLTNSVIGDPRVGDQEWAKREGMVSFAGYPLLVEGRLLGVMAMFARHPLSDLTLDALAWVAERIASGVERMRTEEAREHREAELQESQRIARIGSWEWTIATGAVVWSEGMNHLLARDPGSPSPTFETLPPFYTPESWQRLGAVIARAVETGASYDLDLEMIRADGATCWTTTRGEAIRGAEGAVVKLRGTVLDITERRRAAEMSRLHDACLTAIIENQPGLIWLKDLEGRFLATNRAFATSCGREAEGVVGKTDLDIWPPDLAEKYRADDAKVAQTNQAITVEEIVQNKGEATWFETFKTPVRDPHGNAIGTTGYARDITGRKRTEESRARLAAAVEHAAETIIIADADATILYVNPAFEKTTGFTREEAIGQNPRILKSGKQDAEFYRRMWAVLTRGEVWNGHMTNKRKDGTLYEEDASISPIRSAVGEIANYVSVQRDVTHETDLENRLRQAQKMEVIGRLAGGVAHDFNNILMAVMGYSDLALKALPADDPARLHIEEVRAAGERAAGLTRQLLAFSRKQVLLPKVLNLNDLVGNLSKMLRRLIGEDIHLSATFDLTLGRVRADPGQIEQVITNLAVNARDAMPEGGTLTLQTGNVDLDEAYAGRHAEVTPGRYVLLTISDTGTGMTEEVKAHLFEPFFTTKDQGKGTGLGLPTVYGIVKQSGGHISVHSEVGHGTTFKIYLPRVKEADTVVAPTGGPVRLEHGTETILLVEDEEQVRNLAQIVLEECGYTVLVAGNGPDAIQLAERHKDKIQLLVSDVIMPGMSGRVLAPLLVRLRPGLKVLYMSGYTDASIIREDLMTAGSAFLQKPFSLDVLARKVREVLDAPVPAPATP